MEAKRERGKILMLPWLAYGHISPFLELAKRLSHQNFHIFLCSSPVNLHNIRPKLTSDEFSTSIELVELNLPSLPDLPPDKHTTNGLPSHLIPTLINAYDLASPQFATIFHKLNPDFLISDIFQPWATELASSLNVPVIPFMVVGVSSIAGALPFILNKNTEFPFPEISLHDHWSSRKQLHSTHHVNDGFRCFLKWLQNLHLCSDIILWNSCTEIEGEYMDYVSKLLNKKVVPIGPLIQEVHSSDEKSHILDWLDKKPPKSTVYVSFGSEYYLNKEDREELAHGLESSGVNFIWVLRFPKEEAMAIEEALPDGFVQRIGERGVVVDGWAPQMRILAHESVGGFVCHCGWNSVMEAMVCGVPMIALPMQLDQPCFAKLVESVGVGVEAERDDVGNVVRLGVEKAIREVVYEEKSVGLRRKVGEISRALKSGEARKVAGLVAELHRLSEARKFCSHEKN